MHGTTVDLSVDLDNDDAKALRSLFADDSISWKGTKEGCMTPGFRINRADVADKQLVKEAINGFNKGKESPVFNCFPGAAKK